MLNHPFPVSKARLRPLLFTLAAALSLSGGTWSGFTAAHAAEPLRVDSPELAGISGFRVMWDTPVVLSGDAAVERENVQNTGEGPRLDWPAAAESGRPAAAGFDAVHRSMLIRFPGAAEAIAEALKRGRSVDKAELVLPFRDVEIMPKGYNEPAGVSFLGDQWKTQTPRWHAVAHALRKPWHADAKTGPTYNAYIDGAGYWARFGATDPEADRYPDPVAQAEVSQANPQGRLDVTAMLTDETFGATPGERLRAFADQGVIVGKLEIYDAAFWKGGYEWATATGGRAILVETPRLEVTFKDGGSAVAVDLPAAADVDAMAGKLKGGDGGQPSAVMPSDDEIREYAERFGNTQPNWMPDWQWSRVQELIELGGAEAFPQDRAAFEKWVDWQLGLAPRSWTGFDASEFGGLYMKTSEAMPEPVKAAWKRFWTAWLVPHMPNDQLAQGYIGGEAAKAWYDEHGDWRGNFSVYRTYVRTQGTMNFNHWATAGVLFGGGIVGDDFLAAEGRFGLEHFPVRLWSWFDGSTQESIDHYYFAISLAAQKLFADFGPTHYDQMLGQSIVTKGVAEVTNLFHPGLRRFISSSGRTGMGYLLVQQDGLQHIVHTLSADGALTDMGQDKVAGIPVLGKDLLPGEVGQATLNGPWAPEWFANIVDKKTLPYESTVSFKQWGAYGQTPLWRRSYLGENYGVASQDIDTGNTAPVMAQWRREAKAVESATGLGTMTAHFGINQTNLLDTLHQQINDSGKVSGQNPNGILGPEGGMLATFQHQNKMLVFASPYADLNFENYTNNKDDATVRSLQTTLGFYTVQPGGPTWTIYLDGKPVDTLPVQAEAGQRIVIHDGVSYVGIIPMDSTDLGRDTEVLITDQTGDPVPLQGGGELAPALLIEQYLYKSDTPLPDDRKNTPELDQAYGGFAIEVGDEAEHGGVDAFIKHLQGVKLDTRWVDARRGAVVSYRSGGDLMETKFLPEYAGSGNTEEGLLHRTVNGDWPYLPEGLDRDNTFEQMGRTGELAKNGASLTTRPGIMTYLQTEPISGTFAAYNPLPDLNTFDLKLPGGERVHADGDIQLLRVVVQPKDGKLWIDHAFDPGKPTPDGAATRLLLSGFTQAPTVMFNGEAYDGTLEAVDVDGGKAYALPLE